MPKDTSIDGLGLDQRIVSSRICSHANSSIMLSIGNASPTALAKPSLPTSRLEGLGFYVICPNDVDLTNDLIERLRSEQAKNQNRDQTERAGETSEKGEKDSQNLALSLTQ